MREWIVYLQKGIFSAAVPLPRQPRGRRRRHMRAELARRRAVRSASISAATRIRVAQNSTKTLLTRTPRFNSGLAVGSPMRGGLQSRKARHHERRRSRWPHVPESEGFDFHISRNLLNVTRADREGEGGVGSPPAKSGLTCWTNPLKGKGWSAPSKCRRPNVLDGGPGRRVKAHHLSG